MTSPAATSTLEIINISYDPKNDYLDTGLDLISGVSTIRITASGLININWGSYPNDNGPDGITEAPLSEVTGLPPASLIGKIGINGSYFLIGSSYNTTIVNQSGRLYVGIYDPQRPDNSGSFSISIEYTNASVNPTLTLTPTPTPTPTPTITMTPSEGFCERVMVFSICNSNAAKDDNFDILLNNTLIGSADLNSNSKIGSVFIGSLDTNLSIIDPDFECSMSDMVVYYFDPAIVINGTNEIKMQNTQRNDNGNWGIVGIRNYLVDGSNLYDPCYINNLNYSGSTGASFDFDFDFDKCCYPELVGESNCNGTVIDVSVLGTILRSGDYTSICFRVGGPDCCDSGASNMWSNEVCIPIPPLPPTPTPTPTNFQNLSCSCFYPPCSINGIEASVDPSSSGYEIYTDAPDGWTSCGVTVPYGSLYLGRDFPFSYTLNFNSPINKVVLKIIATGSGGNENFIFTTNSVNPTITQVVGCYSTINNNEIISGAGSPDGIGGGGGGIFELSTTQSFTNLTISGSGGQAGSLVNFCDFSYIDATPTPTPTPTLTSTPTLTPTPTQTSSGSFWVIGSILGLEPDANKNPAFFPQYASIRYYATSDSQDPPFSGWATGGISYGSNPAPSLNQTSCNVSVDGVLTTQVGYEVSGAGDANANETYCIGGTLNGRNYYVSSNNVYLYSPSPAISQNSTPTPTPTQTLTSTNTSTPTPTPTLTSTPTPSTAIINNLFDKSSWSSVVPQPYLGYLNQAADRWAQYIKYNPSVASAISSNDPTWSGLRLHSSSDYTEENNSSSGRIAACYIVGAWDLVLGSASVQLNATSFGLIINKYYENTFDANDWVNILTHELGHALGIGILWSPSLQANGAVPPSDNFLNGTAYSNCQSAYNSITSNNNYVQVPLESSGSSGTASAHWENDFRPLSATGSGGLDHVGLANELMVGFYSAGSNFIISDVSIKVLVDFGYQEVNPGSNEGIPTLDTGASLSKQDNLIKLNCGCDKPVNVLGKITKLGDKFVASPKLILNSNDLEFNINISSNNWLNTNIEISENSKLMINASGESYWNLPEISLATPDGILDANPQVKYTECCVCSNLPYMALIGQIGDGPEFLVGSELIDFARESGKLKLRVNNTCPRTIVGSYKIKVSVQNYVSVSS